MLGSWYRNDELGRRGGTFYVGLSLGALTASLLQGASTTYLDGVGGLAGWRWLFIINAIITLPLAFVGYFLWPGTPDKPNRLVISESDLELARTRLKTRGIKVQSTPFSWALLKRIFTNKRFYILVIWNTFFFNTSQNRAAFLLWIKSLHRFDTAAVNNINAIGPALGIFFIFFINFSADLWIGRPAAITLASAINFTGLVILAIWEVPEAAKWFAFSVSYSSVAVSSVLYGWANAILRDNVEERALTLILMTAIASSTDCWVPLLIYPTVEAPRFPKGYLYSAVMAFSLVVMTFVVRHLLGGDNPRSSRGRPLVALSEESLRASDDVVIPADISALDRDAKTPEGQGSRGINELVGTR